MGFFQRVSGVRPGEFGRVLPFFLLQVGVAAYWSIAASAADSLLLSFLTANGLAVAKVVPWAYLAIALATGSAMTGLDALQARVPRRLLMVATPLALGLSVLAFRAALLIDAAWVRFSLVVWLEVAALISMTLAFSLAGDYFGSRDAKRLYGFIGGGFCLGLTGGGLMVPVLTAWAGAPNLLLFAAAFLLFNAAIIARLGKAGSAALPGTEEAEAPPAPLRALIEDPYLRLLGGAAFLGAALFVVVDFQLKLLASGLPQDQLAAFFGKMYGWAGAAEAALQFGLLRPLIRRAGVLNLQLLYPALMAAGSAACLQAPTLLRTAATNVARMISAESIDRPTRELLFLPLAERLRTRAQPLINGAVASMGQGSAAVLLLLLGITGEVRAYPAAGLALSLLVVLPLLGLRRRYRALLAAAVRSQPIEAVDLARLAHEPGAREALDELLASGDEHEARFARAVLERAGLAPAVRSEAGDLDGAGDPALPTALRCALAAETGRRGRERDGALLWAALDGADTALAGAVIRGALELQRREGWKGPSAAELQRRRAAEAAALRTLRAVWRQPGLEPFHRAALEDYARVRSGTLLALHLLNGGPAGLDRVRLDLWSEDPAARGAAIELAEELLPVEAVAALSAWVDPDAETGPPAPPSALAGMDAELEALLRGGPDSARVGRLKALPLLSRLETPYLLQLLEGSRELSLAQGETLFEEGHRGDALFLVEEGSVSVRSGGREVASLGAGECLGELSVLDGHPRSASALAAAPTRLLRIERGNFRTVVAGRPTAGLELLRTLERRLRAALPSAPSGGAAGPARPLPAGEKPGAVRRLLVASALRRIPLFQDLPEPVLAAIAGLTRPVPVFAGETLFEEGSRGEAMFVIASGRIQVDAAGRRVAELGAGEVLGELALLSGLGRTGSARVLSDGMLYALEWDDLRKLLRDEPSVVWSLLETVAARVRSVLNAPSAPRH